MKLLSLLKSSLNSRRNSRRNRAAAFAAVDSLEERLLLTAPSMTDSEQYMLELINRARANPNAEAARYGIGLNAGLSAGTITSDPKQPLVPQQQLITAARLHSQDMLDRDYFSHTTPGSGTSYSQRVTNQGYIWRTVAENIGYAAKTVSVSQSAYINEIYEGLFRSAGHRTNTLLPTVEEVGIGAKLGSFHPAGNPTTFQFTEMVTQDFGSRSLDPFITGVVYTDADNNRFYTIGESVRGGTVSAENRATGTVYSDTIGISGGYGFVVPSGTYTVTTTFTLNGATKKFKGPVNKVVGTDNVKVDFETNSAVIVPDPVPPTVDLNGAASGTGFTAQFNADALSIVASTGLKVTDPDSVNLVEATARITNFKAGDTLTVSTSGGITSTFTSGVLTLTGRASPSAYQTVLRTLKFNTTSTSTASRSVVVRVSDGTNGLAATATVNFPVAAAVGDIDGDGQLTSQDGNLMTLILLGVSDSTLISLRSPGSTLTAAEIRRKFERNTVQLDVDNDGAAQTQDGNLIALVLLNVSNLVLESLRGPANSPDTRFTATQIKTFVQNLAVTPSAPGQTANVFSAADDFSAVGAAPVTSTFGMPSVNVWPDLLQSGSAFDGFCPPVVMTSNKESLDVSVVEDNDTDLMMDHSSTLKNATDCIASGSENETDVFFEMIEEVLLQLGI
ncbi:MAG: CAP domain-containing protein [Planctomycetaceae bacterium]